MSLIDRAGQIWRTRTCFKTMYGPSGVNKMPRFSYYIIVESKAWNFSGDDQTHHSIILTQNDGEIEHHTIVENNRKNLESRFEFMGYIVE